MINQQQQKSNDNTIYLGVKHWSLFVTFTYRGERSRRPVRLIYTAISADICRGVPEIVKKYNKNVGGVDGADMLMSYYSNNRKSVKVWEKMAFHFIQRMLLNSCVVCPKYFRKNEKHVAIWQAVIGGLASRHFAGLPGRNMEVNLDCQILRMNLVNFPGNLNSTNSTTFCMK